KNTQTHGFVYSAGSLTTFDAPDATGGTQVLGINDTGQIVGVFVDSAGNTRGFVETGDSFRTVDMPGASDTVATGINDLGQITGVYYDNTGTLRGFVDTGGSFIPLDIANASGAEPFGIDGSGQPVGFYDAPTGVQGFGPDGSINVPDTPPFA